MLVEHATGLVMSTRETIAVLNSGQTIAEGIPVEVLSHPDVVKASLGGTAGAGQP
jgi:branched-chain amino acid transport system ATP-binding protein